MNKLVSQFNLKTQLQYHEGKGLLNINDKIIRFDDVTEVEGFRTYKKVISELDRLSSIMDVKEPWNYPDAQKWDSQTLDSFLTEQCGDDIESKEIIQGNFRCTLAAEPSELSMLYVLYFLKAGKNYGCLTNSHGGAQHATIIGGSQQLSHSLYTEIQKNPKCRVVRNSIVGNIFQNKDYVIVETMDGKRIFSHFAVVALSPPLAGRIQYEPPLPPFRDLLTQRTRMGSVIKCFLFYKEPFWRYQGLSGEIFTDTEPVSNFYDHSTHDHVYGIIGFIAGKDALKWSTVSQEERKEAIIRQLVPLFGDEAKSPIGYVEKNWLEEPTSRGGYLAVMPPQVLYPTGKSLRQPIGRLFWTSSECATEWIGYMEGALESAERVFEEVLQKLNKLKDSKL